MIIDAHGHIGEDYVFDDKITEQEQLDTYAKYGIGGAVIQPLIVRPYIEDTREIHDRVYAFTKTDKMKIWGLAAINPHFRPEDYDTELIRCVRELGFVGVKITPIGHACDPASRDALHVFEVARALGIPVMIHTGQGIPFSDPIAVAKAAESFPNVTIVLAHAGGEMHHRQALYLAKRHENVYLEPSWAGANAVASMYSALGATRIMFSCDGLRNVGAELGKYRAVIQKEEDLAQVFEGTARQVFGLR